MLRDALRSLVSLVRDADSDGSGAGRDRFRPSRLDASVRAAHGASDPDVERAMADVAETARTLDGARRES